MVVDTLIEAIGQRPDTSFIKDGVKVAKGGTITADPRTLATDKPGVFAGGDAVTGPKTVIWAVAAGQRAATSIKRYLQGKPLSIFVERDGYEPIAVPQVAPTEEEVKERARIQASEIESKERKSSYKEIVLAFRPNEAREEASRCLRCDLEVGEEE
jgi:NADPH-dependent glutamate synthase beta subunit-like oxidoreductase